MGRRRHGSAVPPAQYWNPLSPSQRPNPRVSRTVLYPYRTHVPYLLLTCSSSVRIFSALRSRTVQVSAFGSPKPTSSASGWLHLQYLREGGTPAGRMGGRVVVVVVVVVVVAIFGVCTECCMLYVVCTTVHYFTVLCTVLCTRKVLVLFFVLPLTPSNSL